MTAHSPIPAPMCGKHPERPSVARGMCMTCYQRERRSQRGESSSVERSGRGIRSVLRDVSGWDVVQYMMSRSEPAAGGCRNWVGAVGADGRGIANMWGRGFTVHRLMRAVSGGDPFARVVVQTCGNPRCIAPEHLADREAV